jgi:hypothetical protein
MNDTANEVFYLTEDEKAKVTWYHLATYKIQEEQHGMASCINDAASEATVPWKNSPVTVKSKLKLSATAM